MFVELRDDLEAFIRELDITEHKKNDLIKNLINIIRFMPKDLKMKTRDDMYIHCTEVIIALL